MTAAPNAPSENSSWVDDNKDGTTNRQKTEIADKDALSSFRRPKLCVRMNAATTLRRRANKNTTYGTEENESSEHFQSNGKWIVDTNIERNDKNPFAGLEPIAKDPSPQIWRNKSVRNGIAIRTEEPKPSPQSKIRIKSNQSTKDRAKALQKKTSEVSNTKMSKADQSKLKITGNSNSQDSKNSQQSQQNNKNSNGATGLTYQTQDSKQLRAGSKPNSTKLPPLAASAPNKAARKNFEEGKYIVKSQNSAHQIFMWHYPQVLGRFAPSSDACETSYEKIIYEDGSLFYFLGQVTTADLGLGGRPFQIEGGVYIWFDDLDSSVLKYSALESFLELQVRREKSEKKSNIQAIPLKRVKAEFMSVVHSGRFPPTHLLDMTMMAESKLSEQLGDSDLIRINVTHIVNKFQKSKRSDLLMWLRMDPLLKLTNSVQILFPTLCYQK